MNFFRDLISSDPEVLVKAGIKQMFLGPFIYIGKLAILANARILSRLTTSRLGSSEPPTAKGTNRPAFEKSTRL